MLRKNKATAVIRTLQNIRKRQGSRSRSYKNHLANDSNFNENIKTFILEKVMPEFIWIGEISSKQLIKQKQANGLVIIDATENSIKYFDSLIFAGYADRFYHLNYTYKELQEVLLSLGTFNIYTNNLKGF